MGSGPTIIPLQRIAVVAAAAVAALLFAPLAPANADQAPQESMVIFSAEEIANAAPLPTIPSSPHSMHRCATVCSKTVPG